MIGSCRCTPICRAIIASDHLVLFAADSKNPICSPEGAESLSEAVKTTMDYLKWTGSASNAEKIPFELR